MHITITLTWWMIPAVITISTICYALFVHKDGPGYFSGLGNFILLVPAMFISMASWIVAAFLK